MLVKLVSVLWVSLAAVAVLGDDFSYVMWDLHDGDQKQVRHTRLTLTIKPYANNETWVVNAPYDEARCDASIDFNVTGKPSPPPVPLLGKLWIMRSCNRDETLASRTLEFTDPTATIAPSKTQPVNQWVSNVSTQGHSCELKGAFTGVFQDMHDGDEKHVELLQNGMLKITPYANNETWVVVAFFDHVNNVATIDFDVPGKPSPPPVPLVARLWELSSCDERSARKPVFQFTDPSGVVAPATQPLNQWVKLDSTN